MGPHANTYGMASLSIIEYKNQLICALWVFQMEEKIRNASVLHAWPIFGALVQENLDLTDA